MFHTNDCLSISNLACQDLPEISVSHSNLTVIEGDRVTITCNGSGVPVPEVDWTVGGLHSINTHQVRRTFSCSFLTRNKHFIRIDGIFNLVDKKTCLIQLKTVWRPAKPA